MKSVRCLALAACVALVSASAHAQTPTAPAQPAVTPAQVEAAERALRVRGRTQLRPVTRTAADRLAAVRTVRQSATAADLGATVALTPRAPHAAGKAWLNTTLGVTDLNADVASIIAYKDEFAPQSSIEIIIANTAARRYVVECPVSTLGATQTRATVYSSDAGEGSSWGNHQQIKQDTISTAAFGSVVSVVTPATPAPFLQVVLDVPAAAIDSSGSAVLTTRKCEVTPFAGG